LEDLTPLARLLLDGYSEGNFDEVSIAYTRFREGTRLQPVVRQLLPIAPPQDIRPRQYIYEPSPLELLRALLPRIIRFQLYEAFLESLAAENTSRMVAMRTATSNAGDIVSDLSLSYNKARQEAITSELMDILGGTAALERE
jgi:F-type H+-transporting ATPase subunit gamma